MDSQILYLIIGVLVGAIAIYFFIKKNSGSGDNSVLSSQLADLIVRFSKVEEATKNISSRYYQLKLGCLKYSLSPLLL